VSVFVETSTHTYSLSEEGFGYNYGGLKSSASHWWGVEPVTCLAKSHNGPKMVPCLLTST